VRRSARRGMSKDLGSSRSSSEKKKPLIGSSFTESEGEPWNVGIYTAGSLVLALALWSFTKHALSQLQVEAAYVQEPICVGKPNGMKSNNNFHTICQIAQDFHADKAPSEKICVS
jgi:hypothetical protein